MQRRAPWQRRSLLLVLAGVHGLAFLLWPAPERPRVASAGAARHITWLTLPSAPATPTLRPVPVQPRRSVLSASVAAPAARAPQAITLPPAASVAPVPSAAPPDPFAVAPAAAAPDLRQALRSRAGQADQQLRKESWNPRDKVIARADTALARGMGAAFQGDGGVTQENITTPDGRMMTRVRAGGSTYCAQMQSNSLVGGRDVFRDGVKTQIGTCPR